MENTPPTVRYNTKKVANRGRRKRPSDPNKVMVVWDNAKHEAFVRICLDEMRMGNKPSQTLNKSGYDNLEKRFELETNVHYHKDQFKNHWDRTRKEWQTWKALQGQTGLGFNEVTGTYDMSHEWWIEFSKGHPGAKKFQAQPLYFEEELDILFGACAAQREDSYIPTSGSSARGKRSFRGNDSTTIETKRTISSLSSTCTTPLLKVQCHPHPMLVMKPLAPIDRALYHQSLLDQRGLEWQ
ncbi:hypothetical protein QJS10_CPB12g01723 [Acorus calamus]|uniref:Myb/SANT-like domain-containing protein n=1 Tax=Acorus calamus TaxID=4465 RepID=A0AAV9DNP2_ACOCL|nr:hypothetical protein QJS10_CPB12g01723 [Acorus calamus]